MVSTSSTITPPARHLPQGASLLSPEEPQNHRMTRVGRDLEDHVVPTPLPGRATKHTHLLDQVAQGPVQPGLEHLQGWGKEPTGWYFTVENRGVAEEPYS